MNGMWVATPHCDDLAPPTVDLQSVYVSVAAQKKTSLRFLYTNDSELVQVRSCDVWKFY